MTGIGDSSWLHKGKYAKFKNETDDQTSVIVIPPQSEENKPSTEKGLRILNFNLSFKLLSIYTAIIFIILLITGAQYFKDVYSINYCSSTDGEISHPVDPGDHTKLQNSEEINVKITQETTEANNKQSSTSSISVTHSRNYSLDKCVPLNNTEKVILTNVHFYLYSKLQTSDYVCSDNATCHSLLHKIEEEQNGSKYNFVIGAGGDLYVGLGFRCLMNSSENALYIKYIDEKSLHGKIIWKIKEVIDQGVSCGYISENFTLLHEQNGSQIVIDESLLYYRSIMLRREYAQNRSFHFHDPNHEMRTLIHGDFKWTVCGNFSNTTKVQRSRVITLDSIPKSTCLPLEPVSDIVVDVVVVDPFSCSDNSTCIQLFEEQHEGFKYNFIIGNDLEVYVGLGYKCRAEHTSGTELRVRVLILPEEATYTFTDKHRKFVEILEEGVACGKVLENFYIKPHCHDQLNRCDLLGYMILWNKDDLNTALDSVFRLSDKGGYHNEEDHIISEDGRGIVPGTSRFRACKREHISKHNTTVSAVEAEPTPDTSQHSPFVDDDLIYFYD